MLKDELTKKILDSIPDALLAINRRGRIAHANRHAAHLFGYSVDDLEDLHAEALLPTELAASHAKLRQQTFATPRPRSMGIGHTQVRHKDGTLITVNIKLHSAEFDGEQCFFVSFRNTEKSKLLEDELRRTQRYCEAMFQSSNDGLFIIKDGRFIECNEKLPRMLKRHSDEILNHTPEDISPPLQPDGTPSNVLAQRYLNAAISGEPQLFEWAHTTADDDIVLVEVSLNMINIDGEDIIFGAWRDITERKLAEQKIIQNEERIKRSQVFSNSGTWEWNIQTNELYWSDGMLHLLGYEPGELEVSFDSFMQAIHWEDRENVQEAIQTTLRQGDKYDVEHRVFQKNRSLRWIQERGAVINDQQGQPWKMLGVAQDITARKNAEEAVRQSESLFRLLFDSSGIGIAQVDLNGYCVLTNKRFQDMVGYTLKELQQLRFTDITHPEDRGLHLDDYQRLLRGQQTSCELEKRYLHKNGRVVWAHLTVSAVHDPEGQPLFTIATVKDITHEKQADEEVKKLEFRLQQAQKMETLGQLTGGIAHDFNNILASILGYAQLADNRFSKTSDAKLGEYLKQIINSGKRAKDLVHQMLAFSRNEVTQKEAIDVPQLIAETVNMLRSTIVSSIEIKTDITEPLPSIEIDAVQLQQTFLNLVLNARDALSGAGNIHIRADTKRIRHQHCASCHETYSGNYLRITVEDSGSGIAAEHLTHIFEPFFTTKEVGKGTGMGLAMVHGLTHQSNGHIDVHTDAQGTRISLLFPLDELRQMAHPHEAHNELEAQPGRGFDILVVDDEPSVASFLAELLQIYAYDCVVAHNGPEALEAFRQNPQRFGLVIADHTMPKMTGVELDRETYKLSPATPVIIYTGNTRNIHADDIDNCNITHVIAKPVNMQTLLQILQQF